MKVIESLAKRECKPVDYEVDALRALMLTGGVSAFGLSSDFTILLVAVAIMVIIGGKLYLRVTT